MKLAIDPGHGLSNRKWGVYDPGAVSEYQCKRIEEAGVVMMVALTLKFKMVQAELAYWLTRTGSDDHAPLVKRVDYAEDNGCTRYLSIHMNSSNGVAHGTETYYRNEEDRVWAEVIHNAAIAAFNLKDRGLKAEGDSQHNRLEIFDFAGPTCLCELGFIDYPIDLAAVMNRNNRMDFTTSIIRYLERL